MDKSVYPKLRLPPAVGRLLRMAGLPLLDGFFLTFLAGGLYREPASAIAFGLTAFSGAGCMIAAMNLGGSLPRRLAQVGAVYAAIALAAAAISLALPTFQSILPANLSLFTAIFLVGLGLHTSGAPRLAKLADWLGFQVIMKLMILSAVCKGLFSGVTWQFTPDPRMLHGVLIAAAAGAGLSAAGALLGQLLHAGIDRRFLDWGAGLSLVLMGFSVAGLRVPSAYVIIPLSIGLAATLVRTAARRGRPACRLPAAPLQAPGQ